MLFFIFKKKRWHKLSQNKEEDFDTKRDLVFEKRAFEFILKHITDCLGSNTNVLLKDKNK